MSTEYKEKKLQTRGSPKTLGRGLEKKTKKFLSTHTTLHKFSGVRNDSFFLSLCVVFV